MGVGVAVAVVILVWLEENERKGVRVGEGTLWH